MSQFKIGEVVDIEDYGWRKIVKADIAKSCKGCSFHGICEKSKVTPTGKHETCLNPDIIFVKDDSTN